MKNTLFPDDPDSTPHASAEISAADDRTLRMASPPLDAAQLAGLVRYQEAFLAEAEPALAAGAPPAAVLPSAHEKGLAASGLSLKDVERGSALLRAFSGRRWTLQRILERYRQLEGDGTPQAEERRARVEEELARLQNLDDLQRRYGAETLALLMRAEKQLVPLHARLVRVLGQG